MSGTSNIATTMLGLLKSYPEILLALSCFLLLRRCLATPRAGPTLGVGPVGG
ncbi:hypothetical protein QJS04_geneDACA014342 [Acorus gramineus]|uniref:Uncharacterized protein n=1 Tax=Acorus gramineus TaxID=55184 RepID=A0AAV9AKK3_ACOGR|nr:hypothetical protein QJS04_geneDACA014342 [Acorus gramineus]